jgi:four helix bundle protein
MPNFKAQMTNQAQNSNDKKIYDLSERTALYGENVIIFIKSVPETTINKSLISQVIRSATSIGANYMEADGAESKKDFQHKIGICKKEAKETMHWFRMLAKAYPNAETECRKYWKEAHELTLIFSSIINSTRK